MNDKVIVITGASDGIGAALAKELVRRGAKGVVLAARREAELNALAKELGPTTFPVVTDVTRRADVEQLVARTVEKLGQLDVIVNNAGRGISKLPSELTDDDIDDMMTVNLKSVLYGIQAVLPQMKKQGHGQIIAVSSGLARFPFAAPRSAYAASKAAVNLLMGTLRQELRGTGIQATTVMPGVVATEFGNNALHGGADSKSLPGAQPVDEVATVIADVIEKPVAECYTRPQMRDMAAAYFSAEDVGALEGKPPFFVALPT
ncbi:MAG TPA: SDR family oxidoreductase, partial [Kofleriaceae bacterium]